MLSAFTSKMLEICPDKAESHLIDCLIWRYAVELNTFVRHNCATTL